MAAPYRGLGMRMEQVQLFELLMINVGTKHFFITANCGYEITSRPKLMTCRITSVA